MLTALARMLVTDFESALPPTPSPTDERLRNTIDKRRHHPSTDQGAYGLVSGEKLSDAERDELRWLRNRTIQQRTADVFVHNTTDQRLIRNAFLQGFGT